jgi:putative peptidoglycan lipid II flippase
VGRWRALGPSATVSLLSFAGLLVGFGTQLLLAALFGAGSDMDAYLAAATLPQFVIAVLINSLNYVFIPVFVEHRRRGDLDAAWRIASTLVTIGLVLLGGIAVIGMLFAAPLQRMLVPGFAPETLRLTVALARLSWPTVLTLGMSTLLAGLYQSHERFGWAAAAPVLGAMITLAGTLLFAPTFGIAAVAAAALGGSLVQLALLAPMVLREPRFRLSLREPPEGVRTVLRLMVPLIVGTLFSRAAILVDRVVASKLATGSLAYLGYANKLVAVIVTVLASGLSVTTLVTMSEHAAGNDAEALRATIASKLRLMWFLVAPVVALLIVLRVDFVGLIFERGRFTAGDTSAVAGALPWYLFAMIAMALGGIVSNGYYAIQDTKTPAVIAVIEVIAYAFYMPALAGRLGYLGVAMGFAIYWDVSLLLTAAILWWKTGRHAPGDGLSGALLTFAGAVAGAGLGFVVRGALPGPRPVAFIVAGLAGCAGYVGVLALFRSLELRSFWADVRTRIPWLATGHDVPAGADGAGLTP